MALSEADIEEFIRLLQQNAELRERVRRALINDNFERITAALAQSAEERRAFEAEMRQFQAETRQFQVEMRQFQVETRERFEQVDERFAEVAERDREFREETRSNFERVDARLAVHDERFDRVEKRLDRIEGDLGNLRGDHYEFRLERNPSQRLGRWLRNAHLVALADSQPFQSALERGAISHAEWDDALETDLVVSGSLRDQPERGDLVAAVEVSRVVDIRDAERALRRARVLQKAGLQAIACVAGDSITQGARSFAEREGVFQFIARREPAESGASAG